MTDIEGIRVLYTADTSSYESGASAVVSMSESVGASVSATTSAVETLGSQLDVIATGFNGLASSGDVAVVSAEAVAERLAILGESAATAGADMADGLTVGTDSLDQLAVAGTDAATSVEESFASINFSALADAITSLTETITSAVTEIDDQIDSIATNAEESASRSQSAFSGFDLGGMVNQVGFTVMNLQNMVNVSQQVAGALLGPAMSAEQTQQSFTNLLGSSKAASDELNQLNTFAAKTQFKTSDIDLAASTMIGFSFKAKSVIPDLTAVGDALTAVGRGTPAQMQSVVDIFGKMQTAGKLTQGDITQLGAHGINALQAIAAGSGLSTAAIQEMVKKGTFPASQAIDDLTKGIEKNPIYSGGMAKQAGTLTGLLSTMQSNWQLALASFGSPIIKDLEGTMNDLGNILASSAFKDFAANVGQAIANVFGNIQSAASQIDFSAIGKGIAQIGQWAQSSLIPALQAAAPQFAALGGAIGKVATTVLPQLIQGAEAILPPIIRLAGAIAGNLAAAIPPVIGFFQQWGPLILGVASALTALFIPAMINSGVQAAIAGGKMVAEFVSGIVETGVAGWEAADKLIAFVAQIVASGVQSVVAGGKIVVSFVADMAAAGAKAVVAAAQVVASFIGSLIEAASQAVLTGAAFVADLIPAVVSFAAEALAAAATAIPAILVGFGSWVVGALAVAAANIAAFWPVYLVIAAIAAVIAIVILIIKNWGAIVAWLQGVWSGIVSFFQMLISDIVGFFKKWGLDILEIMMGPVGLIIHFWSPISAFFSKLWSGIVSDFRQVFGAIGSIAQGIWNGFMGGVKGAFNFIIGLMNDVIRGIDAIHVNTPFGAIGFSIPLIPMLASGGIVPPGGIAIAGETGKPEIVMGGTHGATVVGVSQTAALMASAHAGGGIGGSGGQKVTLTVPLVVNGREFARATVDDIGAAIIGQLRGAGQPRNGGL